jgi:quercetin dioxygenase-like cupin family protein
VTSEYRHGKARRIVTGLREGGTSTFARDEEVEQDYRGDLGTARGAKVYRMWAIDRLPVELPYDGLRAPLEDAPPAEETPEALRWSSPLPAGPEGMRVSLIEFEPDYTAPLHWHDTLDIQWLVSGALVAILDDGSEVELRPGDCLIAHAANHAWRAGSEGAVVAVVRLGGNRVTPAGASADARSALTPDQVAAVRAERKRRDGTA